MIDKPILVTGATGFVGQRLLAALRKEGIPLRCGSRNPERATERFPDYDWVYTDLEDPSSLVPAMDGIRQAYFLVHLMGGSDDYAKREREAAAAFAAAAEKSAVSRIIYLGGVAPQGVPSKHLQSRIDTGEILRAGRVPTIELRGGMIIGSGSESWKICRDLATRLPFMVLPKWMESRSCPIAIDDVIVALVEAGKFPTSDPMLFDLPGPEVLSAKDILLRTARQQGMEPKMVPVPVLTPRLSSYWLRLVSGANYLVARQLVHGLVHDLLPSETNFWDEIPHHTPIPFDQAVRLALAEEGRSKLSVRFIEKAARVLSAQPK